MAQTDAMAGMAGCCHEDGKSGKDSAPCKSMAATCLAMAGCATVALQDWYPLTLRAVLSDEGSLFWQEMPTLYGRSIPPEPNPPSHLG